MPANRANPAFRLLLSAPSGGLGIALTTQITVLSWLLQSRYHLAVDDIALVWAAGPLAGIVGQLAAGHASDRTWLLGGRRRPWLVMSGVLSTVALFALLYLDRIAHFLDGASLVLVAGGVALALDVAVNVGLNPARALIADVVAPGNERSLTFAYMQTLSGILGVGIAIIGAWLGNLWMIAIAGTLALPLTVAPAFLVREPRHLTSNTRSAHLPFWQLAGMLLPVAPAVLLVVVLGGAKTAGFSIPTLPLMLATSALTGLLALPIFLTSRRDEVALARRILLAQGLSWIGIFAMFVFLAPVARENLPWLSADRIGRDVAVALGLFNLVAAVAPLVVLVPLTRRFRRAHVHAASLIAMGVAFGAIGWSVHSEWALWAWMALAGIGWGSLVSLPYAMFCDRVDARRLGLLLGVFNLAVVVPQLVVSFGLGAVAPGLASRSELFAIAAIALFAAAGAWALLPPSTATMDQS